MFARPQELAKRMIQLMDLAAEQGGPVGCGGSPQEAAHALTLVRSAILSTGGLSAAVRMMRAPEAAAREKQAHTREERSKGAWEQGDGMKAIIASAAAAPADATAAAAAADAASAAAAAAAAAVALLARLCVGNHAALTELRIDGGYGAVAAMLRRSNDPAPSARAVVDASALIVAGVGESALAARKAVGAGLIGILREHVRAMSSDVHFGGGLAMMLADGDGGDDHVGAVLAAYAELKSRERERDRTAAAAAAEDNFDSISALSAAAAGFVTPRHLKGAAAAAALAESAYVDIVRFLPPACEPNAAHVPAAAAAFAAVVGGAPHTRAAAAAALEAAACVPAMSHLPLGTRGHAAGAIIEVWPGRNELNGAGWIAAFCGTQGAPGGADAPAGEYCSPRPHDAIWMKSRHEGSTC